MTLPDGPRFKFLTVERQDHVALVGLNRPPVNAMTLEMYHEVRELFSGLDEYLPDVRAVVLHGEGRMFSAGNDLNEFLTLTRQNAPGRMRLIRDAFASVYDCPVPVIAAVHGYALGSGMAMAASCDVVVCADTAWFGAPEVGVGVMGGAKHLSRLVPQQVMRLMYFTADPLPAPELLQYGGIARLVPEDRLLETAMELTSRIARHSTLVLRAAKESLNTVEFMDLKAGYEFEQRVTGRLADCKDSLESRRAVAEKRAPLYGARPVSGLRPSEDLPR